MEYSVELQDRALDDLFDIFVYVAEAAGIETALAYRARIEQACARLQFFPERGTPRDDYKPGWRSVTFERRALILYRVLEDRVLIERVLPRGRDLSGLEIEPD